MDDSTWAWIDFDKNGYESAALLCTGKLLEKMKDAGIKDFPSNTFFFIEGKVFDLERLNNVDLNMLYVCR